MNKSFLCLCLLFLINSTTSSVSYENKNPSYQASTPGHSVLPREKRGEAIMNKNKATYLQEECDEQPTSAAPSNNMNTPPNYNGDLEECEDNDAPIPPNVSNNSGSKPAPQPSVNAVLPQNDFDLECEESAPASNQYAGALAPQTAIPANNIYTPHNANQVAPQNAFNKPTNPTNGAGPLAPSPKSGPSPYNQQPNVPNINNVANLPHQNLNVPKPPTNTNHAPSVGPLDKMPYNTPSPNQQSYNNSPKPSVESDECEEPQRLPYNQQMPQNNMPNQVSNETECEEETIVNNGSPTSSLPYTNSKPNPYEDECVEGPIIPAKIPNNRAY